MVVLFLHTNASLGLVHTELQTERNGGCRLYPLLRYYYATATASISSLRLHHILLGIHNSIVKPHRMP